MPNTTAYQATLAALNAKWGGQDAAELAGIEATLVAATGWDVDAVADVEWAAVGLAA